MNKISIAVLMLLTTILSIIYALPVAAQYGTCWFSECGEINLRPSKKEFLRMAAIAGGGARTIETSFNREGAEDKITFMVTYRARNGSEVTFKETQPVKVLSEFGAKTRDALGLAKLEEAPGKIITTLRKGSDGLIYRRTEYAPADDSQEPETDEIKITRDQVDFGIELDDAKKLNFDLIRMESTSLK